MKKINKWRKSKLIFSDAFNAINNGLWIVVNILDSNLKVKSLTTSEIL